MPVACGVVAIGHFMGRRNSCCYDYKPPSPEEIRYNKIHSDFQEYATCTISLSRNVICSSPQIRKLAGVLITHSKKEIPHDGIFLLLKGLSVTKRAYQGLNTTPVVRSIKFNILKKKGPIVGTTGIFMIPQGSESFPLDLVLPQELEDLPPPQITSDGKLLYKLEAYLRCAEKNFKIAVIPVRFEGYLNLLESPSTKITLQEQLQYRKSLLSRKKFVDVFFSLESDGYLAGETMDFLLVATNPSMVPVEVKVELIQKIWYQALTGSCSYSERLTVLMKINCVAVAEKVNTSPEGSISEEMVWKGQLQVPEGISPTFTFDPFNTINYFVRMTILAQKDKEVKVTKEAQIRIGTVREADTDEEEEDDNFGGDSSGAGSSFSDIPSVYERESRRGLPTSRSEICLRNFSPSFWQNLRARAGSVTSAMSFISEASSETSEPPPYSQLSSRRPTIETLPPGYSDLVLDQTPQNITTNQDG